MGGGWERRGEIKRVLSNQKLFEGSRNVGRPMRDVRVANDKGELEGGGSTKGGEEGKDSTRYVQPYEWQIKKYVGNALSSERVKYVGIFRSVLTRIGSKSLCSL